MPEKQKGVVPRLRFPEFRDAGEWGRYKFGELLTLEYGISLPEGSRLDGPIPVVGSNGIVGFHSKAIVSGPAIVIGRKGSVGEVNWIGLDCYPIDTTFYVKLKFQNALLIFIKLLLENANLTTLSDNGAVPGLNRNDVYFLKTALPSEAEQQKIADCLSSLDEAIDLEAQKLDALKTHKNGLMQQLFPREGETIPRLRFPEFRDAGEWEVKQLGEVCELNPPSAQLPASFIYIDLESVESGRLLQKKKIEKRNAPSRAQRVLKKGDILYQMVRPYQKNNFLFNIDDFNDYVASTGSAQLRAYNSECFLFQLIHTDEFVDKVLAKCTGSNYPAINSSDLAAIYVAIPYPEEQQKIADCLSSLDEVITLQTQKLDALKAHKNGLMQQLFPQEVD